MGQVSYFLHDGQGSTRALVDGSGNIRSSELYTYEAFGNLISGQSNPAASYLYTGQQFDALISLYSLRARYFNPKDGRFLSRDTANIKITNPVEINRYNYAANNSISYFDPIGKEAIEENAFLNQNSKNETAPVVANEDVADSAIEQIVVEQDEATSTTIHGAQRLAERGFSEADIALTKSGTIYKQADGATVYVKEVTAGRYNVIVEGERGIITALKNIRLRAFTKLAERYGWK